MKKDIFLSHHAPAPRRPYEIIGSGTDRHLDTFGRDVAAKRAKELLRIFNEYDIIRPDNIISSNLNRAKDTAEIFSDVLDLEVIERTADLNARDFGVLDGMTTEEALSKPDLAKFIRLHNKGIHELAPGEESIEAFNIRIANKIMEISSKHRSLIVTHGSVIDSIISQHSKQSSIEVEGQSRIWEGKLIAMEHDRIYSLGRKGSQFLHLFPNKYDLDTDEIVGLVESRLSSNDISESEYNYLEKNLDILNKNRERWGDE